MSSLADVDYKIDYKRRIIVIDTIDLIIETNISKDLKVEDIFDIFISI